MGERVSRANGLEQVLAAPRSAVTPGPGGVATATRAVARTAVVSPRLAPPAAGISAIAPGRHAGDFRTLMSGVRDRFGLKPGTNGGGV